VTAFISEVVVAQVVINGGGGGCNSYFGRERERGKESTNKWAFE